MKENGPLFVEEAPCWSTRIRESSFNLTPPPPPAFGIDPASLALADGGAERTPVFSTASVCLPSAHSEGRGTVWNNYCIQRQKERLGWASPLASVSWVLGWVVSCPRALLGAVGSSSPWLVGVLVWFGFLWVISTSGKDTFDETCSFCISGCLLHHGIVMVCIICVCARACVCIRTVCI